MDTETLNARDPRAKRRKGSRCASGLLTRCAGSALGIGLGLACLAAPARAMIFYSTADTSFDTTAPTGSLANSGWQYVGTFDGYAATPIAPNYFLAAHHIGGSVGDAIVFNGVSYTTIAYFDDPSSDLRLWQVQGAFPAWAPLYQGSDETGKSLVVIAMGWGRGAPVLSSDGQLAGWLWNSTGVTERWGTNTVNGVVNGGSYWGQLLQAEFVEQSSPGSTEADLALGDSSGAVFINNGAVWALAGVAAVVDGPFSTNAGADGGFNAAIFDLRGLYYESAPGVWTLIPLSVPVPVSTGFYATRVSARISWINSIIYPSGDTPVLEPAHTVVLALALLGAGMAALLSKRFLPSVA